MEYTNTVLDSQHGHGPKELQWDIVTVLFFGKAVCKFFKQHCEPLSAEIDCLVCGQGEIS
jgi:hypothetical protein